MLLRVLTALCLVLLLPGCITTSLWGGEVEETTEIDPGTGRMVEERGPVIDFSNVTGWADFFGRLLITPLTLILDIATMPVQAFVFGWYGDDEDDW